MKPAIKSQINPDDGNPRLSAFLTVTIIIAGAVMSAAAFVIRNQCGFGQREQTAQGIGRKETNPRYHALTSAVQVPGTLSEADVRDGGGDMSFG